MLFVVFLNKFFCYDVLGGIVLMVLVLLVMIVVNFSLSDFYYGMLGIYFVVIFGGEGFEKFLIFWINDGFMVVFFFLIGFEFKCEMLEGKFKNLCDVILLGVVVIGGMVVFVLIFVVFNWGNVEMIKGWVIFVVIDIVFVVGVFVFLGKYVFLVFKIFLLMLVIFDDFGVIIIIVLFYIVELKIDYLWLLFILLVGLWICNYLGVYCIVLLVLLGVILWFFVLKLGVYVILVGVIIVFFILFKDCYGKLFLYLMEYGLMLYVFFMIVLIFVFLNVGVVL